MKLPTKMSNPRTLLPKKLGNKRFFWQLNFLNLIYFTLKEEKKNETIVIIAVKLLRNILEIDSGYYGDFILSEISEDKMINVNAIFNN